MLDVLNFVPKSVQAAIACLVLGGIAVYAAESRYMTVAQYTKSYVLDLKSEIRAIQTDLRDPDIPEDTKRYLREQLEVLLDDLCYEVPDDPYCENR